jgi:MFS transporter, DHA2 family, multidrug resistance protein
MSGMLAPPPPLRGAALTIAAIALALGTFMQVLDTTIANVSLPTIAGNLGVSADNGTWVITSFACANGVTVPLTGWLMQRVGVVRTFVASVLLFTLSSLLCGIAWNLPSLILFRILQGATSGPMIPGSQALLISIFPSDKRGTALGIWSMTSLVGPITGPVLGGYISDYYSWGWIFLINVPVGLLCAALSWRFMGSRETPTRKLPIDTIGLALLAFWVFSLQTMLDLGKDRDWFNNPLIAALAIFAVVGFAAWIIWEMTEAHPIVDLSLFRSRNFAFGVLTLCLAYSLLYSNLVLMPLWLQQDMGYTATWAGIASAPSGLTAIVATPLLGRVKTDPRFMSTLSFSLFACSYFMRTRFTPDTSFEVVAASMAVQGMAMGCFFVPLLSILLDGVPADRVPSASGLSNFARITAGGFGASLVTYFWDRREALHQTRLVENVSPYAPPFQQMTTAMRALGLSPLQANDTMLRMTVRQAYVLSALDIFWASGWACLVLIATIWLCRKPAPAEHHVAMD